MVRVVLYIVGLGLVVAAAVWLAADPGSASLIWRGWRVDTSVGVLIVAIVVTVLILLFAARVARSFSAAVKALAARRRERRLNRGLTSLGDGFAAVMAGQRDAARKLAREASSLLKDNSAVLMLRKEAAILNGDNREVQAAALAMLGRPETEIAGLRTLAVNALAAGDVTSAREHARRAWSRRDPPAWALKMLLDLEVAGGHWDDALALIDSKAARLAYPASEHAQLKARLFVRIAEAALARGNAIEAAAAARRAMGAGGHERDAVVAYARAMAAQGKGAKAATIVEQAWADGPHASLLTAYRELIANEAPLAWAQRVESLAKAKPDHPESRLAVASAALGAELWGQARNRLSGLTAEGMEPDVRARAAQMLADLEARQRGDADAAAGWLKVALEFHQANPRTTTAPRSAAELLAP